ncbi:unnamed protein product [Heterotrigona itama]|uniref:Trichohyalin n=1 Tax=Heterotrigona itama TaxID=395501 RepID=A0A6V7H366_9HYME|nr:unnamed protein product [Heterotrigona itama]
MQPGATVVLATVWLAVYANLVGTLRINFTADQYSPLAPQHQRHEVYRRAEGQPSEWKDPNSGSQEQSHESEYLGSDSLLARRSRDNAADDFSPLVEDKRPEYTDRRADNRGTKGALESAQRELSPPAVFEDQFVADDTFQDQGPGSVEIYKLDVFRVNSLLSPSPSIVTGFPLPNKGKNKAPKKTSHASWKTSKTPDYDKATSLLNTLRKQSNSFDDLSTEVPANTDLFGIGGVPELQVGCEGLEAAESDHGRERRSIDSALTGGDKNPKREVDSSWVDVTPISLNLDYELSGEDGYEEEMDELLKLKKLESTTKRSRQNRGDMDATLLHSEFHQGTKGRAEKLPVRGDLGKSSVSNESSASSIDWQSNRQVEEKTRLANDKALRFNEGKRDDYAGAARSDDGTSAGNQRRKILWLEKPENVVEQRLIGNEKENGERRERDTWGFGEDEGVVSSDELQTENQRRRLANERRNMIRQEELRRSEEQRRRAEEMLRRNQIENRTNSDIERIRQEYERGLSEKEREEEERRRQLQQSNRWQLDEEHRRRLQEEISRRNRLEGQRRTQEFEALRRRETVIQRPASEEERKRQWQQAIEARRREEDRLREEDERRRFREEEARRKWDEELRRRQQEQDRRSLEDRRREWMLKRKQEEEEEKRRHQQSRNEPSNLLYPSRSNKSYDRETERRLREQQERERHRKLNEYIQRNQPIKVNSSIDRQREEANERRQEEERRRKEEQQQRVEVERKLQDYVRRNQPVRVPKLNESYDRNWLEYRRRLDEARQRNQSRYTGPGDGRRNHGPSAPTNIDPRYYVDDARREAARRIEKEEERIRERQRQLEQQEQLRRYALRREEEARRMQSRKYEEERKRQESVRLEAERRAKELQEEEARRNQAGRRPLENTRPSYENRRRFDDYRRGQDTSLIPTNLVLNESRRATERQRQEQERKRLEAERQRAKETREKEERDRVMKEHRRRQEEARLNALPVSASIIVQPAAPNLLSRINIPRLNPYEEGIKVPNFPVSPTRRPPVKSPSPCVWAVVHCCPSKVNRLITCFESMGCPGINWEPSPCRASITQAAKNQVAKFYAETEDQDEYDYP